MKEIDTPAAVAEYLTIPVQTLAQWRTLNQGPRYMKAGRLVRYRKADVDQWLKDNTKEGDRGAA